MSAQSGENILHFTNMELCLVQKQKMQEKDALETSVVTGRINCTMTVKLKISQRFGALHICVLRVQPVCCIIPFPCNA